MEEELIAAIEAAPDDPAPRMVYADWLEQRGDPRAELVQLDLQIWTMPLDATRVRTLVLRRADIACAPAWYRRVARPSSAEIRRRAAILAELDPAGAARHRLRPPLAEPDIAAFERSIGCKLPAQYRRFVLEVGDGGGPITAVGEIANPNLARPFGGPSRSYEDLPGAAPICSWFGHGQFLLVFSGPDAGSMWLSGRAGTEALEPRIEFLDWYLQRLDEELLQIARAQPDDLAVLAGRDPRDVLDARLTRRDDRAFPAELRRLVHLRRIDYSYTPLDEVPAWIDELTQLAHLVLDHTSVRRLPESLGNLTKLAELSCIESFSLASLPESIGRCTALRSLELRGNKLTALPESIADLPLTVLELYNNCLAALPASLGRMRLTRLNLRFNRLETLPDELAGMTELVTLSLSTNRFRALPACVAELPSLERIELDKLPELDFADAFEKLARIPTLRTVSMLECGLTRLPPEASLMTQIESLFVGRERLTELPRTPFAVR